MVLNINTDEGINLYFTENIFHSSLLPVDTPLGLSGSQESVERMMEDRGRCRSQVYALFIRSVYAWFMYVDIMKQILYYCFILACLFTLLTRMQQYLTEHVCVCHLCYHFNSALTSFCHQQKTARTNTASTSLHPLHQSDDISVGYHNFKGLFKG